MSERGNWERKTQAERAAASAQADAEMDAYLAGFDARREAEDAGFSEVPEPVAAPVTAEEIGQDIADLEDDLKYYRATETRLCRASRAAEARGHQWIADHHLREAVEAAEAAAWTERKLADLRSLSPLD